jgi:radical SAM superfamily enzyme YgiQ (UPF0313 family)
MYIAAYIREQGLDVKIIDLAFIDKKDWESKIGYADIYGMTVFSSSLHLAREVYTIAKNINPYCKVVVGGPHPTSLPKETLAYFDCVVKGEGEHFLENVLRDIVEMPKIKDLDSLPFPARDLVNIKAYTRKVFGKKATSITTSRGCPYSCAFCCKDVFGHQVRNFSIKRVINEIKSVISEYGIRNFIFYDDTFALDRKRFYPLCEELAKLNIIFRCNGDVRNNTLEDFRVLYNAGCREIAFGIESGSQKILDIINKGSTVKQNKIAINNAQKAGLLVKAFLMIGNPGETKETIEETKQFMVEANPDQYTLFNFVPLPGCAIWKEPDKYKIKITNNDFRQYFNIAGNNIGGLAVETEGLSCSDIDSFRRDLIEFLNNRGQRGVLQDYYKQ